MTISVSSKASDFKLKAVKKTFAVSAICAGGAFACLSLAEMIFGATIAVREFVAPWLDFSA